MGAHLDPIDRTGDCDPRQAAGKRLLIHVGVHQGARGQQGGVGRQNLPAVGAVLPTAVGVGEGDIEPVALLALG